MVDKEVCAFCEKYFWKGQLSLLPRNELPFLNRKYCPKCYPNILAKHTELYFEYKGFI